MQVHDAFFLAVSLARFLCVPPCRLAMLSFLQRRASMHSYYAMRRVR